MLESILKDTKQIYISFILNSGEPGFLISYIKKDDTRRLIIIAQLVFILLSAYIIHTFLSILSKNSEAVNKGFALNYYKLSNRRKMIRILWWIPIMILLIITVYYYSALNLKQIIVISILFLIITSAELIYYNYRRKQRI